MPSPLATLLLFLSASALAALPPVAKRSTDPATPLVHMNGTTIWVKSPEIQGLEVTFLDASGQVRRTVPISTIDWDATQQKTAAHQKRIAETGEPVRVLKIVGDPEEAHRMAQSSEKTRKANYKAAMQIPLETEGEKAIVKADELAARMKIAQEKCDSLAVPIWGSASAARIAWIQASIRQQCEQFKAEARRGH